MMSRTLQALGYALLIWIVGFVWGSIVFMTPSLKAAPPIPFVSKNPAISFPLLILWPLLTYVLARLFLRRTTHKSRDGLRLGIIFAGVNIVLDLLVLVLLLQAGFSFFISLTLWVAYVLLLFIPWLTGRSLDKATGN
jgi:hypothetical protein